MKKSTSHIIIHRGTHQIGGCVTEIRSKDACIFIDIGKNLPGVDSELPSIDNLTVGNSANSALFLTHYHGDHIGLLSSVLSEIPVHMGKTAKAIQMNYVKRMYPEKLPIFERILTFTPLDLLQIGSISITPLMIDHSAFDAYMFIIETDGFRILYTGDFRFHGIRGNKTLQMLKRYVKNIDYIICEGTLLTREGELLMTEHELKQKAAELMKTFKYVFVLCSSTHIDRIGVFYHANPKGRMFVCDGYQKEQLETVREAHADKSGFYNFKYVRDYAPNLDEIMEAKGFCMLVRQGEFFKRVMNKYKDRCLLIYSMWTGYLDERAKNQALYNFVIPYRYRVLHTSGHAPINDLKRLYETIQPKYGLIPIHSKMPELFREIVPEQQLILLNDREILILGDKHDTQRDYTGENQKL